MKQLPAQPTVFDLIPEDFLVFDHGSILLLRPVSDEGRTWIDDHLPDDALWHGDAVAIERRYFEPIYHGILNDGLTLA